VEKDTSIAGWPMDKTFPTLDLSLHPDLNGQAPAT
jgi:hypothetical protein